MSAAWPLEPLGNLLSPIERAERVDHSRVYKLLGARWYAQGLFVKEEKSGQEIKASTLYRVKAGDFVYNRLFAWKGSFAIAHKEADGCYVSNEFPCFAVNSKRLDPLFLKWWFNRESAWFCALGLSSGATPTSRNRLKEQHLLGMEIPLPSLDEQRCIVTRIEDLAAKVERAIGLRSRTKEETSLFLSGALNSTFESPRAQALWSTACLPSVADIARGKFGHRPRNDPRFYGGETPFIQIGDISASTRYIKKYSQSLNEEGLKISRLFPAGTIVIAITGATIGVTGILGFDAAFPDSIVGIQPKLEFVTAKFLYLAVEHAKHKALKEATQTTQPNINLGNLERLEVRIPSLAEQSRIVAEFDALHSKCEALKALQAETSVELDAMLPAILDRAFRGLL